MASDRRTQARIDLRIRVELTLPGRNEPVRAFTRDLSWGGALLQSVDRLPKGVNSLILSLPWRRGKSIRALAHVLRERPLDEGGSLIALRFVSLSPRSQSRLERLLKMLQRDSKTGESGSHALFRELEVAVSDAEELRQTLLQILDGTYRVTVFEAYQVGQGISLSIAGIRDLPGIRLRARVLDVEQSTSSDYDWARLHTLSLAFEHPSKAIHSFIDTVLNRLSESSDEHSTYSYLEGAPDWLRSATSTMMPPADVDADADPPQAPAVVDARSYLESEFPEAIVRIVAGWGDVKGFEVMFDDLILGNNGLPNGWPLEAWEELMMLQGVHDRAYGISERRRSLLKGGRV